MQYNKLAKIWDLGGIQYDNISRHIADAINHSITRLEVNNDDNVLDIATGTGWTAREIARSGVHVTGVDFSCKLLEAAKQLAKKEKINCNFYLANAERLPFKDNQFSKIISIFGIIFCHNPKQVVKEMARICKANGKVVITAWTQNSSIYEQFKIFKKHTSVTKQTSSSISPFQWGNRRWLQNILGKDFEINCEEGNSVYYSKSPEAAWDFMTVSYGPLIALMQNLNAFELSMLKKDLINYYNQYRTELGIAVPRKYKVIVATKLDVQKL